MELEERKLKEIEHSRQRREILKGFERYADTHAAHQVENLEELVKDPVAFKKHFANMKYYSITRLSDQYQREWLAQHCKPGLKVLDFACGNGENGIIAAGHGADVLGIDISPEGVLNANANASDMGLSEICKFLEMDGENMDFADNTFDLGVEYGALHHVDLNLALAELSRVLKPSGRMICVEALRHNPLIHWYRNRTPHLRTEWEVDHILGVESLDQMRNHFSEVNVKYFHLASLLSVPFRKTALFDPMLKVLEAVDNRMLSNAAIGKYGWIMVVEIANPIK